MLEDLINELPVRLALFALPLLATIAVFYWRRFQTAATEEVEARVGETQFHLLENWARSFILAAEQITGIDTNEEKKNFVLDALDGMARQLNIPVTRATLSVLIEGTLKLLKVEVLNPPITFPGVLEVTVPDKE